MHDSSAGAASSPRPVGILAALLAIVIAAGAAPAIRAQARRLADRHVDLTYAGGVPFKYQTLTLQRAALASGHVLPIYGSSELICCGGPYRPTQVFGSEPSGFGAFAVGRAGTADLFFTETFAALGADLKGKKLVISDSPPWFYERGGLGRIQYAGNFLPEIAFAFLFDAPISRRSRQLGARRMLTYPATLEDEPLLRMAAEDLAYPTPWHRARHVLLTPLGRAAVRVLAVRDAIRTAAFIWWRRWLAPTPPPRPTTLDWVGLATRGTAVAEERDTTNPFGFPDDTYRDLRHQAQFKSALELYRAGVSNRDGRALPAPTAWEAAMSRSAEWGDLRLELQVLREVGARPLLWTLPMPGAYDDYTRRSLAARSRYYERYARVAEHARVPWLDFRAHDEDRDFVTDPASHLSPRGWVFADLALDLFWHEQPIDDVRATLATLAVHAPAPPERAAEGNGGTNDDGARRGSS